MVSLILIKKNNKFLLLKRSPTDNYYPSHWCFPGGSIDKNETPQMALVREIKEEMNITLSSFTHFSNFSFSDQNNIKIYLYVHENKNFNENEIILNEEHTEFRFFTYVEITKLNNVISSTLVMINTYLNI